ncbi:MAG: PH domain-containing protein [Ilumatobacteraceae bacterium]
MVAMPYPKKLLNSYETVALDLHPHWWYFVGPVDLPRGVDHPRDPRRHDGRWDDRQAGAHRRGPPAHPRFHHLDRCHLRPMGDHQRRHHQRPAHLPAGVLGKSGIEIPLERVNNVNFSQSVFERLIGAGDLLIESGGEDGQQRFTDIRHPEQVQKLIHEQMEGNEQRKFGGMRTASPAMIDPITQLERLEALRDRGTITQEEFELQKRRILE